MERMSGRRMSAGDYEDAKSMSSGRSLGPSAGEDGRNVSGLGPGGGIRLLRGNDSRAGTTIYYLGMLGMAVRLPGGFLHAGDKACGRHLAELYT